TCQTGGNFKLELKTHGATGSAGTEWDQLAVTGTLDLTGLSSATPFTLQLQTLTAGNANGNLASWNGSTDHTWLGIVTTTGGFVGTFSSDMFVVDTSGFSNLFPGAFSVVQNGNNLDLKYVAVPEPSSL